MDIGVNWNIWNALLQTYSKIWALFQSGKPRVTAKSKVASATAKNGTVASKKKESSDSSDTDSSSDEEHVNLWSCLLITLDYDKCVILVISD